MMVEFFPTGISAIVCRVRSRSAGQPLPARGQGGMRLGWGPFFSCPGRSAARVLRAGVHSTLHGVVFAIFVQALLCTAEGR